jgi:adenylosuccinate lyase
VQITDEGIKKAFVYEQKLRHDVMAHVHALGDEAPQAKAILHLGMTSQDVVCNADLYLIRESLSLIELKIARAIDAIGTFAEKHATLPCLGYTHYQPAQPTTWGRRAAPVGYDLSLCLARIESNIHHLKLRGLKGATGTQASFMTMMDGSPAKMDAMEGAFVRNFGWFANLVHELTSQTYPRVVDAFVPATWPRSPR